MENLLPVFLGVPILKHITVAIDSASEEQSLHVCFSGEKISLFHIPRTSVGWNLLMDIQ